MRQELSRRCVVLSDLCPTPEPAAARGPTDGDPSASGLRTARFEPVGSTGLRFVDARGRNTQFDFTTAGLITKITAPGSVITHFTYDTNGRVTSIGTAARTGDRLT